MVDNIIILSVKQKDSIINEGELVFLMWDRHNSNINVNIHNLNIYKNYSL